MCSAGSAVAQFRPQLVMTKKSASKVQPTARYWCLACSWTVLEVAPKPPQIFMVPRVSRFNGIFGCGVRIGQRSFMGPWVSLSREAYGDDGKVGNGTQISFSSLKPPNNQCRVIKRVPSLTGLQTICVIFLILWNKCRPNSRWLNSFSVWLCVR